jgi:hypothetical protein
MVARTVKKRMVAAAERRRGRVEGAEVPRCGREE